MIPVEVLDLRLLEPRARWLAVALVRIGPAVIRHVRVIERDGRLKVRLPGVSLDQPVFLDLAVAVLAEFRRAREMDTWVDRRRKATENQNS